MLFFSKVNKSFEEIIRNEYLTIDPTNDSKEMIKILKNCGVKSEIWLGQ